MTAIAGVSLVLAGLGLNLVAVAVVSSLLLTFAEIAAIRVILARIPKEAELDTAGRLREAAATVLLGVLVAALAALGSLVEVSGQIVAVLLGAVAIGVLGKVIATAARA
jgi:hypothetical protein